MTLIVGIRCSNGIVVGADGAATYGVMGQSTTVQPVKKLTIIDGKMILGVAGAVGIAQRFHGMIVARKNSLGGLPPTEVMRHLRTDFWSGCLETEFKVAEIAQRLVGQAAQSSCLSATIFALACSKQLCLIQFDQNAAPEMASGHLPFITIGSGQPTADPFLAFIRRIFWGDRVPNLAEGIFATYWTLHHAIMTSPGGVADPKQIAVLEPSGNTFAARELTEQQLLEHQEAVGSAEEYLRDFQNARPAQHLGQTPAIPKPS
jgi:hypothetical protein